MEDELVVVIEFDRVLLLVYVDYNLRRNNLDEEELVVEFDVGLDDVAVELDVWEVVEVEVVSVVRFLYVWVKFCIVALSVSV